VKPTADASMLTNTAKMEVKNLTKNYILIFWGCVNVVDKMHPGRALLRL